MAIFWTIYVFGSSFRTLAVILFFRCLLRQSISMPIWGRKQQGRVQAGDGSARALWGHRHPNPIIPSSPSSVRRTLELFQRQRWCNLWKTRWRAYGFFRAHRYNPERNCHKFEDVPLVGFIHLIFTRMPGESYRRRLRSSLLNLFSVFRALINSLVCWFWTELNWTLNITVMSCLNFDPEYSFVGTTKQTCRLQARRLKGGTRKATGPKRVWS